MTNVKLDGILGTGISPKSTGIPPISLGPTIEPILSAGGLAKVTDIFGNTRVCDSSMVDVFSGLPVTVTENFQGQSIGGSEYHTPDEWKLNRANELEGMINPAVDHYKDAKARGDTDEMLKWETEANKHQGILFNHLGISPYTLTPKALGIS